jgi:hypothetical protein
MERWGKLAFPAILTPVVYKTKKICPKRCIVIYFYFIILKLLYGTAAATNSNIFYRSISLKIVSLLWRLRSLFVDF